MKFEPLDFSKIRTYPVADRANKVNAAAFSTPHTAGGTLRGFLDTFREFEKGGGHYSWWSQMSGARARNIGWRIDYWLISAALRPRLRRAWILKDVTGSDHCPVGMELG